MIGRYRLLELLGEGDMGQVYLAEQQEPVHRRVALKIVKLGMDTMQVVARFRAEQQTLAMLDHPNIAHVFDAGTTESVRPYFVMEYVQRLPDKPGQQGRGGGSHETHSRPDIDSVAEKGTGMDSTQGDA